MGLSSNQARFLSLTSRQIDMEQRIQQICQRRLRLSSELENVATSYNNSISNRKMFSASQTNQGIKDLTVSNLAALGYRVMGLNTDQVKDRPAINPAGKTVINSQDEFMNLVSTLNGGSGLNGNYVLNCDIDLSKLTLNNSLITGTFTGNFDGNGHVINGLNINTSAAINNIGLFSRIDGSVKNLDVENISINTANASNVGGLAGVVNVGATIDNCMTSGDISARFNIGGMAGNSQGTITNSTADVNVTGNDTTGEARLGGFVGSNNGGGVIKYSNSTGDVTSLAGTYNVGGFSATNEGPTSLIESCYSTGNVNVLGSTVNIGTFTGGNNEASIKNCYTTGNLNAPSGANVAGFIGDEMNGATVTNSYTTGTIANGWAGAFSWVTSSGSSTGPTNFFKNNLSYSAGGEVNGNAAALPTGSWDSTIWDKSTTLPILKQVGYTAYADDLETGLRNGTYSLAKAADEFTQDPISLNGNKYEEIDWRTAPEIYDELYKGDDATAEDKYDKTIDEINSQDKKLQLEQTSIETEYKAVTSEKEAVKKILDTNASSSFKYFS